MKKLIISTIALLFGVTSITNAQQPQNDGNITKAQAPSWMVTQRDSDGIALVDPLAAQLAWVAPVLQPTSTPMRTTYTLRIVELMPQQQPDVAIEKNPIIYQRKGLLTTQFIMPRNVLRRDLQPGHVYVTQLTAEVEPLNKAAAAIPMAQGMPGVPAMNAQVAQPAKTAVLTTSQLIQNDGKSELLMFRLKE